MPDDTNRTESLCPVCLGRIPAARVSGENDTVFLEKRCPAHGDFRTLIWKGPPSFHGWRRPKIPARPPVVSVRPDRGCPFDCGLCPDHRQKSCTVLLEVTPRCDLACPVCYADAGRTREKDPSVDAIDGWFREILRTAGPCNIQLSGGEPTVRDDLPEIAAAGRRIGFPFIQINTNGIRLGRDDRYAHDLKSAGVSSVFLQFDGIRDTAHRTLRGRPLMAEKTAALERCRELGIGVVLVPTLAPGINTDQIGDILRFAVAWSPTVRAVHFQPVSYFGRHPDNGRPRLTLPEVMRAACDQTDGLIRLSDFRPPGCENAWCSFHADYLVTSDGGLRSLRKPHDSQCRPAPVPAGTGAAAAIAYAARQWAGPGGWTETPSVPAERPMVCGCVSTPMTLDAFIVRARTHIFSVSAMAFQDAWNLDLDRVRDCCIHVFSPDRRLIPFCLYNLTDMQGRRMYRP